MLSRLTCLSEGLDVTADATGAAPEVEVGLAFDVVVELASLRLDLQSAHLWPMFLFLAFVEKMLFFYLRCKSLLHSFSS